MRNQVNSLNRRLKKEHFRQVVKGNTNNTRKLWKTLRDHGGLNSKKSSTDYCDSTKVCINRANQINDHFCSVGHNVVSNITNDISDNDIMSNNERLHANDNVDAFRFTEIKESYVFKQLQSLSVSKATSTDEIPAKLFKIANIYISSSLAHICNVSIKKGKVPDEWKEAKVTPIHKGGDKDNLNNWIPISALPIISKILEWSVHNQLYACLQDRNILSSKQLGFRPNYSTQTVLINVTDHILTGMDDGKVTGIVFLDLRKAFDTVSHDLMSMKLHDLGVRDVKLTWFTCYLKERKQTITSEGILSDQKWITIGVPQGSILGPLLFSIYVNDLPKKSNMWDSALCWRHSTYVLKWRCKWYERKFE